MNFNITDTTVFSSMPEYTVTVYGPTDSRLTFTIIQMVDGLWRAHNRDNGWVCFTWPDTDLQTQLRWVKADIRRTVRRRREERREEQRKRKAAAAHYRAVYGD
jgi:hypothetical protein